MEWACYGDACSEWSQWCCITIVAAGVASAASASVVASTGYCIVDSATSVVPVVLVAGVEAYQNLAGGN